MLRSFNCQGVFILLNASVHVELTLLHASEVAFMNLLVMTYSVNGDLAKVDRSVCSRHNYPSSMERSLYVPAFGSVQWKVHRQCKNLLLA